MLWGRWRVASRTRYEVFSIPPKCRSTIYSMPKRPHRRNCGSTFFGSTIKSTSSITPSQPSPTFARLPEPRVAPVSIEQQIRDALHTISLPEHVQVSVHIPHDLPEILADTHQLLIVLRNLIQNARDAMPHGGKIQFDVSNEERTIRIAVRDEGVGIPPEILHRIGNPSSRPKRMEWDWAFRSVERYSTATGVRFLLRARSEEEASSRFRSQAAPR